MISAKQKAIKTITQCNTAIVKATKKLTNDQSKTNCINTRQQQLNTYNDLVSKQRLVREQARQALSPLITLLEA